MDSIRRSTSFITGFLVAVALLVGAPQGGMASEPMPVLVAQADDDNIGDPLESLNRIIFDFNDVFLRYILKPIATLYKDTLPEPVQKAVNNVLHNLSSPVVLANDILQGNPDRAMNTLGRLLVNSTAGIGGIRDVGADLGMPRHGEDFGQTLGVWGVGEGFYLVVPIFGPSSPRDVVGKFVVDGFFDPFNIWADNTDREYLTYTRMGVDGVDTYAGIMEELDEIKKTSIDYYAAVRSMYRQKRAAEIRNGKPGDLPPIPDISYDLPRNSANVTTH